jgi:O-antigen/teichoic acid export membrane protein
LFTIILLPFFSKMIKQGESVIHLLRLAFNLLIVPAIIITLGCVIYRYEIIGILYHEHVQSSARVFGILVFSFLGICITYIFGTLLTANGSLIHLNIMAGVAVAINLTLNFILIRKYGVTGAAVANMATQVFTSVCQIILVSRIFRFPANYPLIFRLIIFTIIAASAGWLIHNIEAPWFYTLGLYLLASVILSFALGLLRLKPVWEFVFTDSQL